MDALNVGVAVFGGSQSGLRLPCGERSVVFDLLVVVAGQSH
jgi:hypothetical protein